jgi:protein disulfide-isomerase
LSRDDQKAKCSDVHAIDILARLRKVIRDKCAHAHSGGVGPRFQRAQATSLLRTTGIRVQYRLAGATVMQLRISTFLVAALLALPGWQQSRTPPPAGHSHEIAWRQGDVADAFAEAKELGKPVLLYWGASWCPPCAQMKVSVFKDPRFIAETEKFVPVYLDGDTEGAQRWAERFATAGYPTLIVLRPDGTEVTRINGASTAAELLALMRAAAARTSSIESLLNTAATDAASLKPDDWRILAGFDWTNDPKHFADASKSGALLDRLAVSAPEPALRRQFGLAALAVGVAPRMDGKAKLTPAQQARVIEILQPMLASPREVAANYEELFGAAPMLVASLSDDKPREALRRSLVSAADALYADKSLPLNARMNAINPELWFAAIIDGAVPPALLAKVRERVAWANRTASDKATRQSVINTAAYALFHAGDVAGATNLLVAELSRSDQPYYYMDTLADFAEMTGDKRAALEWKRKAFDAAEGPATRVQWGIGYSNAVLRLAPDDKVLVEKAANAVIADLAKNSPSYFWRSRVSRAAWGKNLRDWSEAHGGGDTLTLLRARMAAVCERQGSEADSCKHWSYPPNQP